jgi:hypothetical protein
MKGAGDSIRQKTELIASGVRREIRSTIYLVGLLLKALRENGTKSREDGSITFNKTDLHFFRSSKQMGTKVVILNFVCSDEHEIADTNTTYHG